jgi:hypothetical protein
VVVEKDGDDGAILTCGGVVVSEVARSSHAASHGTPNRRIHIDGGPIRGLLKEDNGLIAEALSSFRWNDEELVNVERIGLPTD